MREAPCISTDQSEIQEATTNHKGPGKLIIAGSLQKIKEEYSMQKLNIELPPEALELAAGARDYFPGLTDPEIAVELLKLGLEKNEKASVSMQAARITLIKMLLALSDDALEYVWRPIIYAYYYTDQRDPDRLTDDDVKRLSLIGVAARSGEKLVSRLDVVRRAYESVLAEKGVSA